MKNGIWLKIDMYCRCKWLIFYMIVIVEMINNKKVKLYNVCYMNVIFL